MIATIDIKVPRDALDAARLSAAEARVELAVHLFAIGRLGFGKARELADLPHWQFRQLLGGRGITVHYGVEELEEDLALVDRQGET